MSTVKNVYTGHCHCGAVEWEVTLQKDPEHILCHCGACKRIGGGEYSLNLVAPKDDCKFTKGADKIKEYVYKGDSRNDTICSYCSICTSHPWHWQTVQGPVYVVRTALLDGAEKFPVTAEIYAKDRWTFQEAVKGAHSFDVVPPS